MNIQRRFIILFFALSGCLLNQSSERNWISSISEESGLLVTEFDDSLSVYFLSYNKCDTNIVDYIKVPILERDNVNIRFKVLNDTVSIIFYKDSTIFEHKPLYGNVEHHYNLYRFNGVNEFTNRISSTNKDFNSFLSSKIKYQENLVMELSSEVEVDIKTLDYIQYFDSLKRKVVKNYIGRNYSRQLCLSMHDKLDSLIIKPKYSFRNNLEIVNIYQSRKIFSQYLEKEIPNSKSYTDIVFLSPSELLDSKIVLENIYATTGEVIMFYNELILKIYLNEYYKNKK